MLSKIPGYKIDKINGNPKGVYLPISKLLSISAVSNLLTPNNISQICNCVVKFHYRRMQLTAVFSTI